MGGQQPPTEFKVNSVWEVMNKLLQGKHLEKPKEDKPVQPQMPPQQDPNQMGMQQDPNQMGMQQQPPPMQGAGGNPQMPGF